MGAGIALHIIDLGAEAALEQAQPLGVFLPITLISVPTGIALGMGVDRSPTPSAHQGDDGRASADVCVRPAAWTTRTSSPLPGGLGLLGWILRAAHGRRPPGLLRPDPPGGDPGRDDEGDRQRLGPALLAGGKTLFGSYTPDLHGLAMLPVVVLVVAAFSGDPRPRGGRSSLSSTGRIRD